jgi:hypothetical protein
MPPPPASLTNPKSSRPSRRGAPLGNLNALKHGFYSRRFKQSDLDGLEDCDFDGLKDEITIMRLFIRRFIEQCRDSTDLYETAGILRILCLSTASLTRLIKTQHLLATDANDLERDLRKALEQVGQKLGISLTPDDPHFSSDPDPSTPDP